MYEKMEYGGRVYRVLYSSVYSSRKQEWVLYGQYMGHNEWLKIRNKEVDKDLIEIQEALNVVCVDLISK